MNDFPGQCMTNSHVLHDFAEIAYIVCTHAIPASTGAISSDVNSPEQILLRLKNAEKQFRQASILVALDTEKLELFTFYKKVDVVRDQRTILSKFGHVCRLNSCIIARKSAARVFELLKPESGRVYHLFIRAVLASIKLRPCSSEKVVPIGLQKYLVPVSFDDPLRAAAEINTDISWQLCRINLQVTTAGQIILTVQQARTGPFTAISVKYETPTDVSHRRPNSSMLYLAPTGQLARRNGNWYGRLIDIRNKEDNTSMDRTRKLYASMVSDWLEQRLTLSDDSIETCLWIDIEIPVIERKPNHNFNKSAAVAWKPLIWPTSLIFQFHHNAKLIEDSNVTAMESDPLTYIEEWYNTSGERSAAMAVGQASADGPINLLEEPLFGDEIHFEAESAITYEPPVFAPNHMIYPTPPEGILAHPTPGISVDGIAATPGHVSRGPLLSSDVLQDQEMQDVGLNSHTPVDEMNYGDDLFEEMPGENFGTGEGGDEPNWDFFDQPGFAMDEQGEANHDIDNDNTTPGADQVRKSKTNIRAQGVHLMSPTAQPETAAEALGNAQTTSDNSMSVDSSKPQANEDLKIFTDDLTMVTTPSRAHGRDMIQQMDAASMEDIQSSKSPAQVLAGGKSSRRRSSLFDSVPDAISAFQHDQKYQAQGKYWFGNINTTLNDSKKRNRLEPPVRPVSVASDSSNSSTSSDFTTTAYERSNRPHSAPRPWTEYHPEASEAVSTDFVDFDTKSLHQEAEEILLLIGGAAGNEPFLYNISKTPQAPETLTCDIQKILIIAQVLVDQVSQSRLLGDLACLKLQRRLDLPKVTLSMDHSEEMASIPQSNLNNLTSLNSNRPARVTVIDTPRVCVGKAHNKITINASILAFWDTMGIQPLNGVKDITAFCLHPSGSNVSAGCEKFLERMSETYVGCNLGGHSPGHIAGLTNNGLLPWSTGAGSGRNLKSICHKLGAAIASLEHNASMVMIYIVSPEAELSYYRDICHAFTTLCETFLTTLQNQRSTTEIALQIIPVSSIASPDTLVIPDADIYLQLSLEVYNRLPLKVMDKQLASCSLAAIIEKPHPKSIEFDLGTTAVNPISKDGIYLHLAYAYSANGQWLVAAWTDVQGLISLTMSYCVKGNDHVVGRSRREVLRDMWEISHDIMEKHGTKWRLVVTKSGYYEDDELRDWLSHSSQNNGDRKAVGRLVLASVSLDSGILLQSHTVPLKSSGLQISSHGPNISATPVSTPQTSSTSPDQGIAATPTSAGPSQTNAPTPPDHNFDTATDNELVLMDPLEMCWSATLSFGVNQTHELFGVRPAAASGMLIKSTGDKDEKHGLTTMDIHLVATPRLTPATPSQVERDALLENIIDQFRRLALLAFIRGCTDRQSGCIPWHVATAVKGSIVLGEAM